MTLVTNIKLKELPIDFDLSYLRGFFDGWISANGQNMFLDSENKDAIDWAIEHCALVGYLPTGFTNLETSYGIWKNRLTLTTKDVIYVVCEIEDLHREEEVYCVVEPITHTFTLAGGIPTGNCGYIEINTDSMPIDIFWMMDALMCGVGVGFAPIRDDGMILYSPKGKFDYVIPDTREGWCESVKLLLNAVIYPNQKLPIFHYNKIRLAGLPIKGFGGISSGPEPLMDLHIRIMQEVELFKSHDSVYFKTNIANQVGFCTVAGNVRRCFPGTTALSTYDGLKNIDKITENDKVLTINGYKKVVNVFEQGKHAID